MRFARLVLVLALAAPGCGGSGDGGGTPARTPTPLDPTSLGSIAGVVRFPIDAGDPKLQGDLRLAFTVRPAVPKQSLSVFWNEKPLGNLALDDGYKSYELSVPAARVRSGDNEVRFHFRAAGTLDGKHTAAAFERVLALHPWRLALVAEPLWRLLSGQAALRIEGYAQGDPKVRLSDESTSR